MDRPFDEGTRPMKARLYLALAAAAPMLGWAIMASVPATAQERAFEPISEALLDRLRQGTSREGFVAAVMRPLRDLDEDQDGLDRLDVERQTNVREARQRASAGSAFLRLDFDGDLRVSRAEIERYSPGGPERAANVARLTMERYDTDRDGVATLQEALASDVTRPRRRDAIGEYLLELDPNGDDRLTADELRGIATSAFDAFDLDRNGVISHEESVAIRTERRLAEEIRRRREAGCAFQLPSADALFVAYAPYGGQAISSAYIGDESIETTIIDVQIEPGRRPIYLLLTTHKSVIWRFSGAIDRVERVVVASYASKYRHGSGETAQTSASGVIGLPAANVRIANRDCIPDFDEKDEIAAGVPQEALRALLGRAPDVIGKENPIRDVVFPSIDSSRFDHSEPPPVPEGFDPVVWQEAARFYPGGLERIDPASVIAAEPVVPYEVYPNQVGLAQLVGSGHLSYSGEGHGQGKFIVLRTFPHFLASMGGAHSAIFVLPEGIEQPRGSVGHGCILNEEDAAQPNWRRLCHDSLVRPPTPVLRR